MFSDWYRFTRNIRKFETGRRKTYHNLKHTTYIIVEKEKEQLLTPHRIELVPPHNTSHDFHLPEIKQALASQPGNEQYLVDAYLTYLGHTTFLQERSIPHE